MEVEGRAVDSTDTGVAVDVHGIPLVDAGAESELAVRLAHLACILGLKFEDVTSLCARCSHVKSALAARFGCEMNDSLAVAGLKKAERLCGTHAPN